MIYVLNIKLIILQNIKVRRNIYRRCASKYLLFSQFTGLWYFLYHTPADEYDNVECPTYIYGVPVGSSSKMLLFRYDKRCVHKWKSLI